MQEKVVGADAFAEKVGEEKVKVNAENEAAMIEKAKCEQIATEVTEKQISCEADLAAAEPLVQQVRLLRLTALCRAGSPRSCCSGSATAHVGVLSWHCDDYSVA